MKDKRMSFHVNWKRILVLWSFALIGILVLAGGFALWRFSTVHPQTSVDNSMVDRRVDFSEPRFDKLWEVSLTLADTPSFYSSSLHIPFELQTQSSAATGDITMEVQAEVNGNIVFLSHTEIQIIPDTRFGMIGDLIINDPRHLKLDAALVPGVNDIHISLKILIPAGLGEGYFDLSAGPMSATARLIDTTGDGVPEVFQLVGGINYLGFLSALAFGSLATISAIDVPIQRLLDRRV